jgi:hypothetical protein
MTRGSSGGPWLNGYDGNLRAPLGSRKLLDGAR